MRKMFSKNQITDMIQNNSSKLYLHEIAIVDDDIFESSVTLLSPKEHIEEIEDLLSAIVISNTFPDTDPFVIFKFYYDGTLISAMGVNPNNGDFSVRTDIQFH